MPIQSFQSILHELTYLSTLTLKFSQKVTPFHSGLPLSLEEGLTGMVGHLQILLAGRFPVALITTNNLECGY